MSFWAELKKENPRLYELVLKLFEDVVEPCTVFRRDDRPYADVVLKKLNQIEEEIFKNDVNRTRNDLKIRNNDLESGTDSETINGRNSGSKSLLDSTSRSISDTNNNRIMINMESSR